MPISSTGPALGADIAAYRGDTFERWIRIRRNGVEEVLNTSTFKMQIRSSTTVVYELSSGEGIAIEEWEGEPTGVLVVTIPATEMASIVPGVYTYDMQQTYTDGRVRTRHRGTFTITDDITKIIA